MSVDHDAHAVAQLLSTVALELEIRVIDLGALVDSVIAGVPTCHRARIDHVCPRRIRVRGDEARLRFATTNLVNMLIACSAVGSRLMLVTDQHGPHGTLSLTAATSAQEPSWVALEIARKIIEAHGGSIETALLEDTFKLAVELPASRRLARDVTCRRVLLVEDNVEQATALAEVLRLEGLQIDCASSAQEAFDRIAERVPDLMIVDVQLPDLSGPEVIRHAHELHPELPAALLTGYPPDDPMVARAIASTRSKYLGKPVDIAAVLEFVASTSDKDARREPAT